MEAVVKAVIDGEMSYYRAFLQFNAPQTERSSSTLGRCNTVFTKELEHEIISYLKTIEERLFGLIIYECRRLAFQITELNNIDKITGITEKKWM